MRAQKNQHDERVAVGIIIRIRNHTVAVPKVSAQKSVGTSDTY